MLQTMGGFEMIHAIAKELKISNYTLFAQKDDGTLVAANTLSGAIIHIHQEPFLSLVQKYMSLEKDTIIEYNESDEIHKHFYQQGVFVDADVDEYEMTLYGYEQHIVRDTTLNLTLIPTRQCNFRCTYCYEDFQNKHMTDDVYENLLLYIENSLEKKLHPKVVIGLFGGEPFLFFDKVYNFLKKAKEICERFDIPFSAGATTNFALVTHERFDKLIEVNCKSFQVTIDGLANTHDIRRPLVGGGPTFDAIISNLLYARKTFYDFEISLRTNFDAEVVASAEEFYSFIKQNFDDNRFIISYLNTQKWGGANDDKIEALEGENINEAKNKIREIVSKMSLIDNTKNMFSIPFHNLCYASKPNMFIVDCDGILLKCTLLLDDDINKVGKLKEGGVFEIEHKKHAPWVLRYNGLNEKCKDCNILPICFGKPCPLDKVRGMKLHCDQGSLQKDVYDILKNY